MDVSIDLNGPVAVSYMKRGATCMSIEVDHATVYLHGNVGAFRAFAEAILMACPPRATIGLSREVSADGTEVVLDMEVRP